MQYFRKYIQTYASVLFGSIWKYGSGRVPEHPTWQTPRQEF